MPVELKRLTKELAALNRKKQQVLRMAGYNVKVDGNWGRWQDKKYKELMAKKLNKSNVGILALPMAAAAGAGALSIPAGLPIALATMAAAPIYSLGEMISGKTHVDTTPRNRAIAETDATRVDRPVVMATNNLNNNLNNQDNRRWRDKFADKISNFIRGRQKPTQGQQTLGQQTLGQTKGQTDTLTPNTNTSGNLKTPKGTRKKLLNFYMWSWGVPLATDIAGNIIGFTRNPNTYSPTFPMLNFRTKHLQLGYNLAGRVYNPQATDSITTSTTPQTMSSAVLLAKPLGTRDTSVVNGTYFEKQSPIESFSAKNLP